MISIHTVHLCRWIGIVSVTSTMQRIFPRVVFQLFRSSLPRGTDNFCNSSQGAQLSPCYFSMEDLIDRFLAASSQPSTVPLHPCHGTVLVFGHSLLLLLSLDVAISCRRPHLRKLSWRWSTASWMRHGGATFAWRQSSRKGKHVILTRR
jgi:hypothetical protein